MSRLKLSSAADRTYSRNRATIGAIAMSSIATFCRRTSSSSRSSGPSYSLIIRRLGGGAEFLTVDPRSRQKISQLPHQVGAIRVMNLEAPTAPSDRIRQIRQARLPLFRLRLPDSELPGGGFGTRRPKVSGHILPLP